MFYKIIHDAESCLTSIQTLYPKGDSGWNGTCADKPSWMNKAALTKNLELFATQSDHLSFSRTARCFLYFLVIANPFSGWKKDKKLHQKPLISFGSVSQNCSKLK